MRARIVVPGLVAVLATTGAIAATVVAGPSASSAAPAELAAAPQAAGQTHQGGKHDQVPAIGRRWAAAWESGDPAKLARLYTKDAVYTDQALNLVFHGRAGVVEWATGSHQLVRNLGFDVERGFRGGNGVVIEGTFTGHIAGAPRPFAVPVVTVLRLRGDLVVSSNDYYNRGEILSDSGLPADWTPTGS